ncbi:hypothetical protein AGMMS49982_03600 [Bacteroidia bacterium]|nr:hypothetical protein AGMMS49982_03600 [Bacteroidia bacterium]
MKQKFEWSEWKKFPNPGKGEYLFAPFGCGVYELRNAKENKFVLFGSGKNCAYRMSSLLPPPLGQGTRNNEGKRKYVQTHLEDLEYRTFPFLKEDEMKLFEKQLKKKNEYNFGT